MTAVMSTLRILPPPPTNRIADQMPKAAARTTPRGQAHGFSCPGADTQRRCPSPAIGKRTRSRTRAPEIAEDHGADREHGEPCQEGPERPDRRQDREDRDARRAGAGGRRGRRCPIGGGGGGGRGRRGRRGRRGSRGSRHGWRCRIFRWRGGRGIGHVAGCLPRVHWVGSVPPPTGDPILTMDRALTSPLCVAMGLSAPVLRPAAP